MEYSYSEPDTPEYEELIVKYGSILKHIRYKEYKYEYGCKSTMKNWFKPYNYHIISYVKKLLMMLAFPIFYSDG